MYRCVHLGTLHVDGRQPRYVRARPPWNVKGCPTDALGRAQSAAGQISALRLAGNSAPGCHFRNPWMLPIGQTIELREVGRPRAELGSYEFVPDSRSVSKIPKLGAMYSRWLDSSRSCTSNYLVIHNLAGRGERG